jgi:hypothetical protein
MGSTYEPIWERASASGITVEQQGLVDTVVGGVKAVNGAIERLQSMGFIIQVDSMSPNHIQVSIDRHITSVGHS